MCRTTQGPLYSVPSRASDKFPMIERQKVGRVGKEKASAINMQKHRKGDGDLELIWSRSPIDRHLPNDREEVDVAVWTPRLQGVSHAGIGMYIFMLASKQN